MFTNYKNYKKLYCVIIATLMVLPYAFSFGSIEESTFTFPVQLRYLSPGNDDGVQDDIEINANAHIQAADKRTLKTVFFNVYDRVGNIVISDTSEYIEAASYTFNGKNEKGQLLPDGYYIYTIAVQDDKDNISISQPFPVIIDNTPPDILSVEIGDENIVSFNSGVSAAISVSGSKEVQWRYIVEGSTGRETVIYEQSTQEPEYPPQTWEWLGIDENDNVLPDDDYILRVESVDLAGNSSSKSLDINITVSEKGAIRIQEIDGLAFSPNKDGIRDTLPIQVILPQDIEVNDNDYQNREFVVLDGESNEVFRAAVNIRQPIKENNVLVDFTGIDRNGALLADGDYVLRIEFLEDETKRRTNSLRITVDTQIPNASLFINTFPKPLALDDLIYFGGKERVGVRGQFKALEDLDWFISVSTEMDSRLQEVASDLAIPLDENLSINFSFDTSYTYKGQALTDGLYSVDIYATDSAGNTGGINRTIVLDRSEKTLSISANKEYISPYAPPAVMTMNYPPQGLKQINISVMNSGGRVVRSVAFNQGNVTSVDWNGYDDNNQPVQDGKYTFDLSLEYYNGTTLTKNGSMYVDSIAPELSGFGYSSDVINPSNTSDPNSTLKVTQESLSTDAEWTAEIKNIFEQRVYTKSFPSDLEGIEWDGTNIAGRPVPDGDYFYNLKGMDAAGNVTEESFAFIVNTGTYDAGELLSLDSEMPLIYFPAYSPDIFSYGENRLLYENLLNIRAVALLLKSKPNVNVQLIGHAAALLKGESGKVEQTEVLIPLSRGRASQIREALLILGIEESRITTKAVGGLDPRVPNPNPNDIWQNRRVEFILSTSNMDESSDEQ